MGARKFLQSLKPGNDTELARTQYKGQPSASETAAAARRAGHRAAVSRNGDNQKTKVPKRLRNGDG